MPINAGYEYIKAEKEYLEAQSLADKIYWLEEMIKKAPKHKGSENLLAELKTRLKKFKEKAKKSAKKSGGKRGIKKEGFQFVLVGFPNSGKSSLLAKLTNAQPNVKDYAFSTTFPALGTFDYFSARAQVIDMPAFGSDGFDIGTVNNADCLLIVVEGFEDIENAEKFLSRARGKLIIVFNKSDKLSSDEIRKLRAHVKSKRINGFIISAKTGDGLNELKLRMFLEMGVIRVFMKEPGKVKSDKPVILSQGATVRDAAESILNNFSSRVKETRLTGPSGKFPNQKVGLNHILKDMDVVEFHTR